MAKGSGGGGRSGGRATSLVRQLTALRDRKPRSLQQTFGSRGPTTEQRAAYDAKVRDYNRQYRKLSKEANAAVETSNAAFRRRQARGR